LILNGIRGFLLSERWLARLDWYTRQVHHGIHRV